MATPQLISTQGNSRVAVFKTDSPSSEWKIPANPACTTYIVDITATDPVDIEIESYTFLRMHVARQSSKNGKFPGIKFPICITADDETVLRVFRTRHRKPVDVHVAMRSGEWFQAPIDRSDTMRFEDRRF